VAASYGLDIFDVELRREAGQQVLRVVLDRPGPNATAEESVSLDDCVRVSEEISAILMSRTWHWRIATPWKCHRLGSIALCARPTIIDGSPGGEPRS
jgi:hypothetical protein